MRPLQAQRIIYNFSIMFLCLDIKNMEHVAIMKKSWGFIEKILGGQKTIESRWYSLKSKPWDNIKGER